MPIDIEIRDPKWDATWQKNWQRIVDAHDDQWSLY